MPVCSVMKEKLTACMDMEITHMSAIFRIAIGLSLGMDFHAVGIFATTKGEFTITTLPKRRNRSLDPYPNIKHLGSVPLVSAEVPTELS